MDTPSKTYLREVDKCFTFMPSPERTSALNEIESQIKEISYFNGGSTETALKALGKPEQVAASYLGRAIKNIPHFTMHKVLMFFSYHQLTSLRSISSHLVFRFVTLALIVGGSLILLCGLAQTGAYLLEQESFSFESLSGIGLSFWTYISFVFALGLSFILGGSILGRIIKHRKKVDSDKSLEVGS